MSAVRRQTRRANRWANIVAGVITVLWVVGYLRARTTAQDAI